MNDKFTVGDFVRVKVVGEDRVWRVSGIILGSPEYLIVSGMAKGRVPESWLETYEPTYTFDEAKKMVEADHNRGFERKSVANSGIPSASLYWNIGYKGIVCGGYYLGGEWVEVKK